MAGRPQAGLATAQNFVLSADQAFVLLQPEPVVGNLADTLEWSSDGGYLLAARTEMSEESAVRTAIAGQRQLDGRERSLVVYRMQDKRSAVLWRMKTTAGRLDSASWFAGANRFVASVTEPLRTEDPTKPRPSRQSILIFDAEKGTSTTAISLIQEGGMPSMTAIPSPSKPYALLVSVPRSAEVAVAVPSAAAGEAAVAVDTAVKAPVATPAPVNIDYWLLRPDGTTKRLVVEPGLDWDGWNADGSAPIFTRFERVPNARPKVVFYQVDISTGQVQQVPTASVWRDDRRKQDVTAGLVASSLTGPGSQVRVRAGWLFGSADNSKAMIAASCAKVALSPRLNAVAYISDGVALVRPILQLPKTTFLAALADALRQQAMQHAKEAGLATLMYGADFDDQLPLKGMTLSDVLGPYARNQDVFDGFNLTYGGSSLGDIKDPAHTELGYTSGPGGRAVLYADGHVVWIPNP